jgi:hypothetical protein
MLHKTVSYTDYNGTNRTEDLYFNLNESEMVELETMTPGGFGAALESAVKSNDAGNLMKIFKMLILKSYGIKSPDGRRFIKSDEISEEFSQTEAYNKLFMELLTEADKASDFINRIFPADLVKKAMGNKEIQAKIEELKNVNNPGSPE